VHAPELNLTDYADVHGFFLCKSVTSVRKANVLNSEQKDERIATQPKPTQGSNAGIQIITTYNQHSATSNRFLSSQP
jgi:hypothetical protein